MRKKVNFVRQTVDNQWKWKATHYEGNGVFYGLVTSPYVPQGEYGTWYVWELQSNPAVKLITGSPTVLKKLLDTEQTKKAIKFQRSMR